MRQARGKNSSSTPAPTESLLIVPKHRWIITPSSPNLNYATNLTYTVPASLPVLTQIDAYTRLIVRRTSSTTTAVINVS